MQERANMNNFRGIGSVGDAGGAHLALIEGGAQHTSGARESHSALRPAPVLRSVPMTGQATGFVRAQPSEGDRSRHELDVRSAAREFKDFESALMPMVRASVKGISSKAAADVAKVIMANPALRAQAERAFERARNDAS